MESVIEIYNKVAVFCGVWGSVLVLAMILMFVVQLYYFLGPYARIPKYSSQKEREAVRTVDGISVVVLVNDDMGYLETVLPRLLAQEYAAFEVMVVYVGSKEEMQDEMAALAQVYPNFSHTHIEQDPRFPISSKMAYNVGIKGAKYGHIILTTTDAYPVSAQWLSCMAKGFRRGEVLVGYCGVVPKKGVSNMMIRAERLRMSVRYLASAIKRKPYRGIIHNLGFTKDVYFGHRGFNHLNMNIGEDDLFFQSIATKDNVSVVMNPHASVRQQQWGGLGWWWSMRKYYGMAYGSYPMYARNFIEWEVGSSLLFTLCVAAVVILLPWQVGAGALALWLLRAVVVRWKMAQICKRLGEKGMGWGLFFYDMMLPFVETAMLVGRKFRGAQGVWR